MCSLFVGPTGAFLKIYYQYLVKVYVCISVCICVCLCVILCVCVCAHLYVHLCVYVLFPKLFLASHSQSSLTLQSRPLCWPH